MFVSFWFLWNKPQQPTTCFLSYEFTTLRACLYFLGAHLQKKHGPHDFVSFRTQILGPSFGECPRWESSSFRLKLFLGAKLPHSQCAFGRWEEPIIIVGWTASWGVYVCACGHGWKLWTFMCFFGSFFRVGKIWTNKKSANELLLYRRYLFLSKVHDGFSVVHRWTKRTGFILTTWACLKGRLNILSKTKLWRCANDNPNPKEAPTVEPFCKEMFRVLLSDIIDIYIYRYIVTKIRNPNWIIFKSWQFKGPTPQFHLAGVYPHNA